MSADLLAAFGTGVTPADSNNKTHADNTASQLGSSNSFDDDEFDSFVGPEPTYAAQQDFHITASQPTMHNESSQNASYRNTSTEDPWLPSEPGGEVLFDASLEEPVADEDDWGEFETVQKPASNQLLDLDSGSQPPVASSAKAKPTTSKTPATFDLLSLDDSLPLKEAPAPKHDARKLPSLATSHAKVSRVVPAHQAAPKAPPPPDDDFFGEWDDFKDGHEEPKPQVKEITASKPQKQNNTNILNESKRSSISEVTVRPTNIPPPSVILQVFPSVLESFREQVNQNKRKSGAPSQDLTTSLVSTLKATSRVIAGRSHRWKRDTRLSQSMKIGPAGSGKTSGMKLSSVSKGENIKEEQEVVTVIESWRNHTASFNSFVQSSGGRPIPVITDKSRVDTASPEDGALKASHACALCGLKRDERLPKVDEDVQDSFGDWWTEHWGHTDCKRFWEENSKHLSQR
ncbi:hypothetical protein PISL3812_02755 [Talaromyces islandicus]|uniref:Serine/threonine-protein kinase ppk6 n=1 Tax=Talaromyces islandicus TaxID=28573 RepID=A0A0U1LQR7_TALIS|nr:hypothetical protein PISL3812_02755 [Talaromyces islandicus]